MLETIIDKYGTIYWYLNEYLYKEDGPVVELVSGDKGWYLNGKRFKTRETLFKALSRRSKIKALFGESFMKG